MRVRIGEQVLDMTRFELSRDGEAAHVEPQVLRLIAHLVARAGQLVTRDELIREVWGGRIVSDTAISSRIKSARAALGDSGEAQRCIRTVHGHGFRFVAAVEDLVPAAPATRQDLPDVAARPSIAVLPFATLGDCGEWGILAEALSHDLIVELSRLRWLHVIARGSSFRLAADADPREVGRLLGVRYCMAGSVACIGPRMVVTVELGDTRGGMIWAERFEGRRDDVHDIRSRIAGGVTTAIELRIPQNEAGAAQLTTPENLDAWQAYHLGLQHMFRFNAQDNATAARLFSTALAREPGFARAHAGLSFTSFQTAFLRYADIDAARLDARRHAEAAATLDALDPFVNFTMGRSFWLEGRLEDSVGWLERATTLSPNYAQGIYSMAWARALLCDGAGGQHQVDRAMALSPIDPLFYAMMATRAFSHLVRGETADAADWADRAARAPGAHVLIAMIAAAMQALNGDEARALRWAAEAGRTGGLSQADFFRSFPFAEGPVKARLSAALSRVGL